MFRRSWIPVPQLLRLGAAILGSVSILSPAVVFWRILWSTSRFNQTFGPRTPQLTYYMGSCLQWYCHANILYSLSAWARLSLPAVLPGVVVLLWNSHTQSLIWSTAAAASSPLLSISLNPGVVLVKLAFCSYHSGALDLRILAIHDYSGYSPLQRTGIT